MRAKGQKPCSQQLETREGGAPSLFHLEIQGRKLQSFDSSRRFYRRIHAVDVNRFSHDDDLLLFGKDPTSRIVAVHAQRGPTDELPSVVVYRRTASGAVASEELTFYPFFFVSDPSAVRELESDAYSVHRLDGPNPLGRLVIAKTLDAYWTGVRAAKRKESESAEFRQYVISSLEAQFLVQSGRTLFKDMSFAELHRMQVDIEVATSSPFPNAARQEDEIVIVSMCDNQGWSVVLDAREQTEEELLREFLGVLRSRDPDVLEGHNIYGFDMPYLRDRCARYGIRFAIGREETEPRFFRSNMRFAERLVEYEACDVPGRHVVDTYFLSLSFDVFKRDLPGYGLKQVAQYFGVTSPDREYVPGNEIGRVWRDDPDRLVRYALHDAEETGRIAALLSGSTFFLSQMLPMNYGHAARSGPGMKIELLLIREYLRNRRSLPAGCEGTQVEGGYTDVFVTGVLGPIVYADVESLYPSIMLRYQIRPRSDELGAFTRLLRRLTTLRLETKSAARGAASEQERSELDARQSSYKILINSFYGLLGFAAALFNDPERADEVATRGRQILRTMIAGIEARGGTVIEVDTDGVLFKPPPAPAGEEAERKFLGEVGEDLPDGIRVGFDGRYRKMLSYKKKNYALLTYGGDVIIKGSSLISRALEPFGRRFVERTIRLLLAEDIIGIKGSYVELRDRISNRNWHVSEFARTETLKSKPETYVEAVASGNRPRSALYELVVREQETGRTFKRGDRISYYIVKSTAGEGMLAKSADQWNPHAPDEDTSYYLRRLGEFADKFRPFFPENSFGVVFPSETHGQVSLFNEEPEPRLVVSRTGSRIPQG